MANLKITQLTELTTPSLDDILPIVDDPTGTPITKKVKLGNLHYWINWTPTWSGLTVGDGLLIKGRYCIVGKILLGEVHFQLGSTSAVTGDISITNLPVAYDGYIAGNPVCGTLGVRDNSPGLSYAGVCTFTNNTTSILLRCLNVNGTWITIGASSATAPFTWAVNDSLVARFWYPIA